MYFDCVISRPPSAWTLHPPAAPSAPAVVEKVEKKIPKGVPLQFDINSVGKPVRAADTLEHSSRFYCCSKPHE